VVIEGRPNAAKYAIEVYPAATLQVHDYSYQGYKNDDGQEKREEIVDGLVKEFEDESGGLDRARLVKDDHLVDAVVCVLAAQDFLLGKARPPREEERDAAAKEGWIWVASRE
jgi:hypothetical protein